ncbi:type I-F CRISPR-associated protein Csy3 [Moraxella nasovis]|uniref:type I-F CRISPR-associated protein Csy3 n=1 Tax=Moraxella nasovis TaxID=2904121 RepID=UPI001F61FFB9|nr:type I-F CRISPR-associated protein Csy3 [Moraxella nasovis]UNU73186.1 type I-F CRISPR-associated protein Csy3 [Moraxella nasovis]
MAKNDLKTASVLAFERVLDISDAFFWQKDSQDKESKTSIVTVQEKSVRGTISNRLKNAIANNLVKLDPETQKANLQKVDASSLDESNDTLVAKFTCKVLPFTGKPNVCNDQDYQQALMAVVQDYQQNQGVGELAKRYATNIVNARWLWRNRVGAETITVMVSFNDDALMFNAKDFALNTFNHDDKDLAQLAKWIESGLTGEKFVILSVVAYAKIGYGQEVYPSQELILDTGNKKSKVLYRVGDVSKNHAGMHSQKVSNAIRTIDDWYPDAKFPIAVEPYGAVTTLGVAFRQPKQKQDFYSLFDNWVLKGEVPDINQQHYVMGVLIRGGVFGESGKE